MAVCRELELEAVFTVRGLEKEDFGTSLSSPGVEAGGSRMQQLPIFILWSDKIAGMEKKEGFPE